MREKISASESLAAAVDQALLDGAGAHRLHIQAASVVTHPNQYVGAGVPGRQVNGTSGRFPGSAAGFRRLDAVIHAVADQVNQRIVQLIDHGLVEFGIGALDGEIDLFVQIAPRDREPGGETVRTWS